MLRCICCNGVAFLQYGLPEPKDMDSEVDIEKRRYNMNQQLEIFQAFVAEFLHQWTPVGEYLATRHTPKQTRQCKESVSSVNRK